MMISRSAAGLAAVACLVVLTAGCGANSGAPGAGTSHTPAAAATAAPSAPASTPVGTPATTAPATTAPGSQLPVPRCHTSQLTAAYTGLNAAMGGQRGMTLILTNRSGSTCYVYGYPGWPSSTGAAFRWPPT